MPKTTNETEAELLAQLRHKYESLGENPLTYLRGMLQSRPLNYWDYVQLDALLALQTPRTDHPDEEIFIMYHQMTELVLKLMIHEIEQLMAVTAWTSALLLAKTRRLIRYSGLLINSFDVMREGMDYESYNTFRAALAPASGYQSPQFRVVEIYCTPLQNLVNAAGQARLPAQPSLADYFEHIYWKDAGTNRQTGSKTLTLRQFETKYQARLMALAQRVQGRTLAERLSEIAPLSPELAAALLQFDRLYNLDWPLAHLSTAQHYLDQKGENQAATGGSKWKKYLHPHFQQRRFFPALWPPAAQEANK